MQSLKVNRCRIIKLTSFKDGRDGVLSIAENGKEVPFSVQRVYYIYGLNDGSAIRGKHAHKHNQQVIFCINGSFTLEVDDGTSQQEIVLDSPDKGVYMDTGLWHTMKDFSENCILLILASDLYDEGDYIRDYEEFKKYIL